MKIQQIIDNKKEYLDLLLQADPQEDMIDRYLDTGDMFALYENGIVQTVAVVVLLKNRKCELKNIATREDAQGHGYAKYLIHYLCEHYSSQCDFMYVGTGNCRKSIGFYEKCGFVNSHILAGFFVDNYREPIYEDGIQLTDMVYLKKKLDSEVDLKKVLDFALDAGSILLKNGGEIFRVDETIFHICNRFHVDKVDTFTLSHAIIISAENHEGEVYTRVRNVPLSSTHLGIVAEVNALSREIASGKVGLDEAIARLEQIEKIPPKKDYFQILAAGVGSGCFGLLLKAGVEESLIAFVIGCILYVWVLTAKKHHISKIIMNIVGGVLITILAIGVMQISSVPLKLDGMIIGSIMPLIPGVAFVSAIRDIADSDFLSGTVRMIDAVLVFVYIAIGVGFTLGLYNNIWGGF